LLGKRLVAVNSFQDVRTKSGEILYAVDLIPGPARSNWSSFTPCIAEFLSDQAGLIEQRRRAIPEKEWQAVARTSKLRIDRMGLQSARDGMPSQAGFPIRIDSSRSFQPIEDFNLPARSRTTNPLKIVLAVAAVIARILRMFRR
jgi:hypothetical protein